MEFDGEGLLGGLPLDGGADAGGGDAEALDVGWCGSGGGEGLRGGAGGVAGGVEYLDVVGEKSDGIDDEVGRERIDGLRGSGVHGKARQRSTGVGSRVVGGIDLAADLGRERAGDADAVGGVGGGGPVEMDRVTDALGGEVGDDFGQVQGWRTRRPGTGAADEQDDQREKEGCGGCAEDSSGGAVRFGWERHWSQPSIFSSMGRNGEVCGVGLRGLTEASMGRARKRWNVRHRLVASGHLVIDGVTLSFYSLNILGAYG